MITSYCIKAKLNGLKREDTRKTTTRIIIKIKGNIVEKKICLHHINNQKSQTNRARLIKKNKNGYSNKKKKAKKLWI